jgi:murein L,D-transpeptidase YcbB/YkuD
MESKLPFRMINRPFGVRVAAPYYRIVRNYGRVGLVVLLLLSVSMEGEVRAARAHVGVSVSSTSQTDGHQQLSDKGRAALRAILEAGRLSDLRWPDFGDYRTEVEQFYAAADDSLAWVNGSRPTQQALVLTELFHVAENKGLINKDYDGTWCAEPIANLEQTDPDAAELKLIRFDVALTVSAMRYISDLHIGRVNPRQFHFGLDIEHEKYDLSEFLRQRLVSASDVQAVLETIEPPFAAYHRTLQALQKYLELARQTPGVPLVAPRKIVRPGETYADLSTLARVLRSLGDLSPEAPVPLSENLYEGALVDAVKHFQHRHGLEPDGCLDPHTLKELNTPLSRRVAQLQLTLERWRWLPHEFARPPVVVNIPEFRLRAGAISTDVVVGRAYRHKTPVFASEMKQVIFRPYWNVPLSIQRAELVPSIEKNRSYLTQRGYEIVDTREHVLSAGVVTDDILRQLRSGKLSIRQQPGSNNALGLIKFSLPNRYNVYLHATPMTPLFSRARRDFSHGCIRVEDPVTLAVWVLRDKPEWTRDRIQAAMNGDKTIVVNLAKSIPVLILYGTAMVMEDGEVRFFDDIYGHDVALEQALAKRGI